MPMFGSGCYESRIKFDFSFDFLDCMMTLVLGLQLLIAVYTTFGLIKEAVPSLNSIDIGPYELSKPSFLQSFPQANILSMQS